ncbi:75_t:CDS:2, partial [Gigaspora rosea]
MFKIEKLLEDLKDQQIKVATIISDSAPAYAATRSHPAKYVSPEDDDLTLSGNICKPIGDNDWWNTISELHILLSPL